MTATHLKNQLGESPCDDCALRVTCKVQQLACAAFAAHCDGRRWEGIARLPTAERFRQMYRLRTPEEYAKLELELARLREAKKRTIEQRGRRPGRRPKAVACA